MRPEDIPQDVWGAALKCAETALRNMPDDYGDLTVEITAIARAIQAAKAEERERCARIADANRDDFSYSPEFIAAAIRKGEPPSGSIGG